MGKAKKKGNSGSGGGTAPAAGFDYKYLIPEDLDDRTRDLMERFLRNEEIPTEERQTAIDTFVRAIKREQSKYEDESGNVASTEMSTQESSIGSSPEAQPHGSAQHISNVEFEPNPECLSEERQRINVGWMAGPSDAPDEVDRKIAMYCQKLGCQLYNFVSYPIGGVKRGFWKYSGTDAREPPIVDLPDLQLQNHLWETYVNGVVSNWIDCDSSDEYLAKLSEDELLKELNYAVYMGMRSVVILLKHASSPRLAHIISKWLWTKNANLAVWIFVPTSMNQLEHDPSDKRDIWEVWADFRTLCCNFSSNKLIVGINFTTDLDEEFLESRLTVRWRAEPLAAFLFDYDIFLTDPLTNKGALPHIQKELLRTLWMSDNSRVIIRGDLEAETPAKTRLEFAQAVRTCVRDVSRLAKKAAEDGFLSDGHIDYVDVLQAPLQPLADNLDSNVYNTFEQDPVKYKRYREAVEACLKDLGETTAHPSELILYVLGAGRGPLVTASLEAERNYNEQYRSRKDRLTLKVFVVEKNPNATVTLRYMNERAWKMRCNIVQTDMRSLPEVARNRGLPKPDIIVSELLGSFGDNELSPECLDGVTSFLKSTTISIPQTYTSYAAPIMSSHLHQVIRSSGASYWNSGVTGPGREGSVQQSDGSYLQPLKTGVRLANMDQVYVVFLRQYCPLAHPKAVFTFDHPNFGDASNERHAELTYQLERPADIMGFSGYFHMNLYKDVTLSIEPSTFSKGMISWFPAVIPLRKLLRVHAGDEITLVMDRKVDAGGVWYEWQVRHKATDGTITMTDLQNENGDSYYMKLQ